MTGILDWLTLPSGLNLGLQDEAAPEDWWFSGWWDWEDVDGNPCPTADFSVTGFVAGIDRRECAGSSLHFIFSPEPRLVGDKTFFEKTREGGLVGWRRSRGKSYFRQLHVYADNEEWPLHSIDQMLRGGMESNRKLSIKGGVRWVDFASKKLQKSSGFKGWDNERTCPAIWVDELSFC